MLKESGGHSFRGYYILNPEGVVRAKVVSDLPVGIHANHLVRKVISIPLFNEIFITSQRSQS